MRFSLKRILAGTVYVAIAAAAFSQTTWVYADVLWATSLLAVAYVATLATFARGGGGGTRRATVRVFALPTWLASRVTVAAWSGSYSPMMTGDFGASRSIRTSLAGLVIIRAVGGY